MKKLLSIFCMTVIIVVLILYGREISALAAEKVVDLSKIGEIAEDIQKAESKKDAPPWWIGVSLAPVPDMARAQLLEGSLEENTGIMIMEITPGSPAEKAGLKAYDIITHAGGQKITTIIELTDTIQKAEGREISLSILRASVKDMVLITAVPMPEEIIEQQKMARQGMIPGGIQIQIPQAGIQFGGRMNGIPKNFIPEDVRKMMEDAFGNDIFSEKDEDEEETPQNDENDNEEIDENDIILNPRFPKRLPGFGGGNFRIQIPNIPGGMNQNSSFSVSKHVRIQHNGKPLEITITRSNDDPAEIKVKWDGKDYDSTEDKLEFFPEEIREKIEGILKDDSSVITFSPSFKKAPAEKEDGKMKNENSEEDSELKVRKEEVINLKN
ncbi:MAG: PDZ domain-containing protein [Planctomycetia bacterium]|nr:PDZ domain-containing protein [Planctomycetia bacterium]